MGSPLVSCASVESAWFAHQLEEANGQFRRDWTRGLERAEFGHIQQSWEHAVLKSRTGWEASCVGIRQGEILAGALILSKRTPVGSLTTVPCGPWWQAGCRDLLPTVLDMVTEYCRSQRARFCRYHLPMPGSAFEEIRPLLPKQHRVRPHVWSYWNLPRAVAVIDIRGRLDEVIGRMHHQTRRNYRLSLRDGVSVRHGGPEDLRAVYELLRTRLGKKDVAVQDFEYFEQLFAAYRKDRLVLCLAEAAGKLAAFQMVARLGRTSFLLYAAMDDAQRNLFPATAAEIGAIDWSIQHGCTVYDLGGTCTGWPPKETDKGYGVWRHKMHMGAVAELHAPYCDIPVAPLGTLAVRLGEDAALPFAMERGFSKFRVAYERLTA